MSLLIDNGKIVYECGTCRAKGVKLWRMYNTFMNHQQLFCAKCAGAHQDKDVSLMTDAGKIPGKFGQMLDQIGWLIPAVPTEEQDTFWGYTSVPEPLCDWWRSLPNSPTESAPHDR